MLFAERDENRGDGQARRGISCVGQMKLELRRRRVIVDARPELKEICRSSYDRHVNVQCRPISALSVKRLALVKSPRRGRRIFNPSLREGRTESAETPIIDRPATRRSITAIGKLTHDA